MSLQEFECMTNVLLNFKNSIMVLQTIINGIKMQHNSCIYFYYQ